MFSILAGYGLGIYDMEERVYFMAYNTHSVVWPLIFLFALLCRLVHTPLPSMLCLVLLVWHGGPYIEKFGWSWFGRLDWMDWFTSLDWARLLSINTYNLMMVANEHNENHGYRIICFVLVS